MKKHSWSEISDTPISEQAVRDFHANVSGLKISYNSYDPGTHINGHSWPVRIFVLSGRCKYEKGGQQLTVSESEFVDIEGGGYGLEVCSASPVRFVKVFKLPEKYWQDQG